MPHAITAVYTDDIGNQIFSISLYRNESYGKDEMPEGKTVSNWFDDWAVTDDGAISQKPLKTGSLNGFYISPVIDEEDTEAVPEYNDYSYYFSVAERKGVSIYVLEGVVLDERYAREFPDIMEGCIRRITIKLPDPERS